MLQSAYLPSEAVDPLLSALSIASGAALARRAARRVGGRARSPRWLVRLVCGLSLTLAPSALPALASPGRPSRTTPSRPIGRLVEPSAPGTPHPAVHGPRHPRPRVAAPLFPRLGGRQVRRIDRAESMRRHPAGKGRRLHVVVAPGDSLWAISARLLGTSDPTRIAAFWPKLYAANRDVIADPNLIFAGQVLQVPSE